MLVGFALLTRWKLFLIGFISFLMFFFSFDNQENSVSKITWSCVIYRAIKLINYAQSARSSSFLNLGRDDNLNVIDNFTDLHTDLLNSSIIDIRSSFCQRLLRISSIRRSRYKYSPWVTITTRLSEDSGTLIGIWLPTRNLTLSGIPDTKLFISFCIIVDHSPSNLVNSYLTPVTNTANNENFPKKSGREISNISCLSYYCCERTARYKENSIGI